MNPPVPNPAPGSIERQITENLFQTSPLYINVASGIITVTEDKIRLAVHTHLSHMRQKFAWIAPLGIVVTLGLNRATGTFKDAWLTADTWKAFFLLVGIAAIGWLIREVVCALRAPSIEDFVGTLRASQIPLSFQPAEVGLASILTSSEWTLYFNPPKGMKKITFGTGGLVGEGRNNNEHSWRIVNDKLEIFNANGLVFSRFFYDRALQRWTHTNDPDALSIKGQYILKI